MLSFSSIPDPSKSSLHKEDINYFPMLANHQIRSNFWATIEWSMSLVMADYPFILSQGVVRTCVM